MADTLNSSSWYRVAPLKPSLRPHVRIQRQTFRGQRWYVIQDPASGRYHRFTPEAHLVISLMDGERSLAQIWEIASARLGGDNLTQDDVIRLLAQLHQADILKGESSPDLREISARADRQARRKLWQRIMNPLALRLPLFDPDRFLSATVPLLRPLFSWVGLLLSLLLIGVALVQAAINWPALTDNIADRVLATESLLLLLITYPFIKALHELGHGYAAKIWGGEVHEIGVMFLVFVPVPYVDASAATAFSSKWQRALVGSAGMLVELLLAALALLLWLNLEPGLAKAFAFNVMLIGGVSTLLFNGNPLLRFDGYYVLSDLIEIPNLGVRANRYIGYLIQRYLFKLNDVISPVTAPGEARWFLFYGIAAFLYRIFITTTIVLFVASKYFVIGTILAIWALLMMLAWPLAKQLRFLFSSPQLRGKRMRAFTVTGLFISTTLLLLTLLPIPFATVAEGVVMAQEGSALHAGTDGVVAELLVAPNALVVRGQPILRMTDPLLPARVQLVEAELKELQIRHAALRVIDQAEAAVVAEKIRHSVAELVLNREREQQMILRSPVSGRVLLAGATDLEGRFLRQGDLVGYVSNLTDPRIRVLVPQSAIELVREQTEGIRVRFVDRFEQERLASVAQEVPFVSNQLPSPVFATQGGGGISVDPNDASGKTALEMLYQLELKLEQPVSTAGIGSRVYVRFDHGAEPPAYQAYRSLRQLFLKRFSV